MSTARSGWSWLWMASAVVLCGTGAATFRHWWSPLQSLVTTTISRRSTATAFDEHDHGSHSPGDGAHAHDDSTSLSLSPQARGNIGLTPESLRPLKLQTFQRNITVPAIVTERPGRTRLEVSTPMAGVITHVHAVQGEAVAPNSLLFQIRITSEAMIATQTELLKTAGSLEVETREIARLTKAAEGGAIAQRTIIEREYAREKLEVILKAQREAMRLLGVSDAQVDDILREKRLLSELQIVAPSPDDHSHELRLANQPIQQTSFDRPTNEEETHAESEKSIPLILQEVRVHKGETVAAGETLAIVSNASELYVEGQAFENDLPMLVQAARQNWKTTALLDGPDGQRETVAGLEFVQLANEIRPESRVLPFYVRLPNEVLRQTTGPHGQKFVDWRFRLGQRLQLQVPVEEWKDRIVLPVEAVARDGAEWFVFQQNGDHFDRVPVKVDYRDSQSVVVANDGSLFPGDVIALRGAHQMLMALKNRSGGGVDPHAGHNH